MAIERDDEEGRVSETENLAGDSRSPAVSEVTAIPESDSPGVSPRTLAGGPSHTTMFPPRPPSSLISECMLKLLWDCNRTAPNAEWFRPVAESLYASGSR